MVVELWCVEVGTVSNVMMFQVARWPNWLVGCTGTVCWVADASWHALKQARPERKG